MGAAVKVEGMASKPYQVEVWNLSTQEGRAGEFEFSGMGTGDSVSFVEKLFGLQLLRWERISMEWLTCVVRCRV